MANVLANLARVRSATTGTGSLALGAAVTGALSFSDAGVSNGSAVTYAIEDYDNNNLVSAREIGRGTFSGSTLTRETVYSSTNAGAKINCSGRQHVFITAAKEDFDTFLTTSAALSLYQPLDADLTTLAANITAFGHSLVDDADAATARSTLQLGTMATETAANYLTTAAAAAAYQPLDSELTAIAGLTSAADRVPYFTGSGTAALSDFTSVARTLVSQTTQANMRTTGLGLGTAATQNTGTTGNVLPFTDGLNTWTAQQIISVSTNISNILAISTDTSASAGPFISVRRSISGSDVAANDAIGVFNFQGVDTAGNNTNYGQLACSITDPTDTSEDGIFRFNTVIAGTLTFRLSVGAGMWSGSPTGGDMGAGTLNATALYEQGTALSSKYGALASANVFTAAQTVRIDNATTNAVTQALRVSHTTTGTPATGIGVGIEFETETSAGNNEVGATIEAVTTDVTGASEDFDLVIKAMAAGAAAAEVGRHKSTGTYKMPVFTVAGLPTGTAGEISFASNGRKNGEGAGAGTGVLVFHDGTAWRACDTGATVAA